MSQKYTLPEKKELQIHNYDSKIDRTWVLIKKGTTSSNVSLIQKYDNLMIRLALAKATRLKHLQIILNLSRYVNKNWDDVNKEDIDGLVTKIMTLYCSESGQESNTSWDHKKILKIFFRWLKLGSRDFRDVGDPPETKYVKLRKVKDKIIREDLLTEDDITKILHACGENQRDRAFLDCHYDAGTRPGEILSLRIRHVRFDKYGAILQVDGKTGSRPIRIVKSTPNLAKWIDVHPRKNEPDAPLWIRLGKNHYGKPLTYTGAKKLLEYRCQIANMSKRVHLNLFRHSEATNSAKFMTEAQMRTRHGWTAYSKMSGRYTHLVNADVDDAIFEHLGIKKQKATEEKIPKICTICKNPNSFDSTLCSQCGRPLDIETAINAEEKEKQEKSDYADTISNLSDRVVALENIIKNNKQ